MYSWLNFKTFVLILYYIRHYLNLAIFLIDQPKVIGIPDFQGSAKGGVKKMGLWKLIIIKNFCYKAFLNTFIILKFFTAPKNDAVWVLDFLKPYLLKLHFSPLNPNLMAGNALLIFLKSYRNNIKNLASFNKKFMW